MCCRYYIEESTELKPIIDAAVRSPLLDRLSRTFGRPIITSGEVKPTDIAPVIATSQTGRITAFPMVWGFTGKQSVLFNARSESANEKPLWKDSWARRRCVVPASYYFEWEHLVSRDGKVKTGSKYVIQPESATVTFLAGLYRMEDGIPHFAILTREPVDSIRFIHDRMPVILGQDDVDAWVRPAADVNEIQTVVNRIKTDMVFEKT